MTSRNSKNTKPKKVLKFNTKLGIFTMCACVDEPKGNCPHSNSYQEYINKPEELRNIDEVKDIQKKSALNNIKIKDPIPNKASEKILADIADGSQSILVVMPTGSGKSAVIHKVTYLDSIEKGGNVLVIIPQENLISQYTNIGGMNKYSGYHFASYKALEDWDSFQTLLEENHITDVVFDEAHRCLATRWEDSVFKLRDKIIEQNGKCYFFTATPLRATDGRDLREEIIDDSDDISVYMSLEEGVESGLYKNIPDYYRYVGDDDINEIQQLLVKSKISAKQTLSKDNEIFLKILKESCANDNESRANSYIKENIVDLLKERSEDGLKIVVFCESIEDSAVTQKRIKEITDSIPNIDTSHFIYNSKETKNHDNIHSNFINKNHKSGKNKIQIVYAVKLFDEGLHCDNIDMGIILNNTESSIVYKQRIGRFFGDMNKRARILDFTRSSNSIADPIDWSRINEYTKKNENHSIYHLQKETTVINKALYIAKKQLMNSTDSKITAYDDPSKNMYYSVGEVTKMIGKPKNCPTKIWSDFVKWSINNNKDIDWIKSHRKYLIDSYSFMSNQDFEIIASK